MEITDQNDKNRFFRLRKHTYPNFFYSINLSVDKIYNAKKNFRIATLYQKIDRKITFDFEDPGNPVEGTFFKQFNLFRQFYAQTSIFSIKVCFLPNADILDYGNDK